MTQEIFNSYLCIIQLTDDKLSLFHIGTQAIFDRRLTLNQREALLSFINTKKAILELQGIAV
jgi:hypothetical protein